MAGLADGIVDLAQFVSNGRLWSPREQHAHRDDQRRDHEPKQNGFGIVGHEKARRARQRPTRWRREMESQGGGPVPTAEEEENMPPAPGAAWRRFGARLTANALERNNQGDLIAQRTVFDAVGFAEV